MAKLVKTEAVVEGRTEVRWTLVEDDPTPEWDEDHEPSVVGEPATRLTAAARLSGSARYTSDVRLPGGLEAAVLRSPHANARLTSIQLEARPQRPRRAGCARPRRLPGLRRRRCPDRRAAVRGGGGGRGRGRDRRRRGRWRWWPWIRSGSRSAS